MLRTATAGVLTGALLGVGLPAATAWDADYGRLWRDDGVLRDGCHDYTYQYRVRPGQPDWSLETFLIDPRKETIASGGFIAPFDPKRGSGKFRFCRYATKPGQFKIRGKLTIQDGYDQKVRWIKPGYFRLRRA